MYNNIWNTNNNHRNRMFINDLQVPINENIGYLEIIVSAQRGQIAVSNAEVILNAKK